MDMTKVSEIMTSKLVTIDKNSPIREALRLMKKKSVSRLLVTSKGKIVGIVTERDLVKRLGSEKERKLSDAHIYVSSCYTKKLITIKKDKDISEAAKLMLKYGISSLPVVDENGEIIGIVTKTDLVKTLKNCKDSVEKWMRRKVTVLEEGSRVLEARKLMLRKGIKRIPIVSGKKIVGIVTERDIAVALGLFRKVAEGKQWDEKLRKIYVDQIMSKKVVKVKPSDTISKCVKLMLEKEISGLPVVNEKDEIVGIITKTDLLRIL